MRILPNNRQTAIFEKRYWKLTRKVLVKVRQQVVDKAEHVDGDRLKGYVRSLLNEKEMKYYIDHLWGEVGGKVAYDVTKKLKRAKSKLPDMEVKADDKQELALQKVRMQVYSAQRSALKVKRILDAETEAINKVIDNVLEEALTEGLGIQETRRAMVNALEGGELVEIENWQAQRIAMTEVGAAQNTGSWEAAQENSEGVKKIWMFIPGLKSYRENHAEYGNMEPQDFDYEYAPGLTYPHDPDAEAEEVINCYCGLGYDTGN
jgi:hypothetical protein